MKLRQVLFLFLTALILHSLPARAGEQAYDSPYVLTQGEIFVSKMSPAQAASLERGRVLFDSVGGVGCGSCHGVLGEGNGGLVNPLRGMTEPDYKDFIETSVNGWVLLSDLDEGSIRDMAAYTQWLGRLKLVSVGIGKEGFKPAHIRVKPGTPVQVAIQNNTHEPFNLWRSGAGGGQILLVELRISFRMVSFSFLGLNHLEPTGSGRATPTSTFQHRTGHPPARRRGRR